MNIRNLTIGLFLSVPLLWAGIRTPLSAQGLWGVPCYEKSVSLEFAKPVFEHGNESFLSSGSFLSVTWPLSETYRFVGEIPFAYISWDSEWDRDSQFALGNPYVGLSIGKESSKVVGQIGLRLPLARSDNDDARFLGIFADYVGREGAFFGDIVPITSTVTYRVREENGFVGLVTAGADAWILTGGHGDGGEVFALYGVQAGYDGTEWTVLGGAFGRGILTEEASFFDDGANHELGVRVGYRTASVQPTVFMRYPLDRDMNEFMNLVVGLGLRVGL